MSIRQWKDNDPYRYFIPGDTLRDTFRRHKIGRYALNPKQEIKLIAQANRWVEQRERGFYDGNKTEQAFDKNGNYLDGLFSMHRLK